MDFNVPLTTDVGYNRPVETPSAIGAIANIIGGSIREPRQPTQDELFSSAVRSMTSKDPAFRSTDPAIRNAAYTKATASFLTSYPEYASEWKGYTEALGVKVEVSFNEKVEDKRTATLVDWVSTDPEGVLADAKARQEATSNGVFNASIYENLVQSNYLAQSQRKVKAAQLAEAQETGQNALDQMRLEAQSLSASFIAPYTALFNSIRDGRTVELPPDIAEATGFTELNLQNAAQVGAAVRPFVISSVVSTIGADFSAVGLQMTTPSNEWVKDVMGPFDTLLAGVNSTSQNPLDIVQATAAYNAFKSLEQNNPELFALSNIANAIGGTVGQTFLSRAVAKDPSLLEVEATTNLLITSEANPEQLTGYVNGMSTQEAQKQADLVAKTLGTGKVGSSDIPQAVTLFYETTKRATNNAVIGWETFNQAIVQRADDIVEQAVANPLFGTAFLDNTSADIRKTLDSANEDLSSLGLEVAIINGELRINAKTPQGVGERASTALSIATSTPFASEADRIKIAQGSDSFKALSNKWDSLDKFAELGVEIKGALSATEDPTFDVTTENQPTNSSIINLGDVDVAVNASMKPLVNSLEGASSRVVAGADVRMEGLITGPFQAMQRAFGSALVINDAIAKDGTSRESETPNSRHFHGDAIDISTAGMSDEEKMRLVDAALAAGFQGFGFGNNILHVDLGSRRAWAYGNDTFGGMSVAELKAKIRDGKVSAPTLAAGGKVSGTETLNTPEVDDSEAAPTQFERLDQAPASNATADLMADPMATEDTGTPSSVQAPAASATSAAPAVTKEGQALLASLGGKVDKTYKNAAEFQAATAVGDLEAGDIVSVNGELYFIRKDGTPQKVGG